MRLYQLFQFYQSDIAKFKINLRNIEAILKKEYQKNPFNLGGQSFSLMLGNSFCNQEVVIKIEVKDNNVDQALKILKRKLQREGFFRILKIKSSYEKPSEKKKRERQENIRRSKKVQRIRNNF